MTDWGTKMRGGLAWSMVGYGVSRMSTLITTIILAHILIPAQFGLVAAAVVYLALIELGWRSRHERDGRLRAGPHTITRACMSRSR